MRITADFPTSRAKALMGTMAKHFGHKIPVTLTDDVALLRFDGGEAHLRATATDLHLAVDAADAQGCARLGGVLESHLLRFAHRDDPAPLVWSDPA